MDINYFLKKRIAFIRYLYTNGSRPFVQMQQQIEEGVAPFDDPPYCEDGEPAFLADWEDAGTGREMIGLTCISLLSDSLKLYLETLRRRVIRFESPDARLFSKHGFVHVYRQVLGEILATDWSDCPADFSVIEQVVLARNQVQHSSHLQRMETPHSEHTLSKFPRPIFVSEQEYEAWVGSGSATSWLLAPNISVNEETLFAAIEHIEKLADYIDGRLDRAVAWRMGARAS